MRAIHSLLFLMFVGAGSAAKAEQADWKDVKEQASAGIVRVHVMHETREYLKPYRRGDLNQRLGSGFFVDPQFLLTNQHVIEGAHSIKVEGVRSKEKFAMRLAARPSIRFDLALLEFVDSAERERFERINGAIRPLPWADWEEARPGGRIAVLGFGNSDSLVATQGIISNWEERHDLYQRRLDHVTLLRTDAAVNPGNSGGPAVSPAGRVIGISARYGAGENIGLLIPFSTAERVVDVMLRHGEFVKTDTGLVVYNTNPVSRRALGLSSAQSGLVVSHVLEQSPAAAAGVRKWDVIVAVNGYRVDHGEVSHPVVGKLPWWFLANTATPGQTLALDIIRNRSPRRLELAMQAIEVPRIWLPTQGADYPLEWGYLGGMVITEVTRELLEEIEGMGNWRWDLVNDALAGEKLFLVTSIEPETQAMSYVEYGVDLLQLRVLAIDGNPINDSLGEHLDRLYAAVEQGTSPPFITVELEKNLSIKLATEDLRRDMQGLDRRFPGILQSAQWQKTTAGIAPLRPGIRGVNHRWLESASSRPVRANSAHGDGSSMAYAATVSP